MKTGAQSTSRAPGTSVLGELLGQNWSLIAAFGPTFKQRARTISQPVPTLAARQERKLFAEGKHDRSAPKKLPSALQQAASRLDIHL